MMNLEASTRRSTITVRSNQQKNEDYRLDIFGRHIPRILMKQLIAKLTDQFMNQTSDNDADQVGAFSCTPSLGRFDAALLFVDISGFTVLSQRLPVDELRLCINNYFKIILDTIIASDGDVVKFAGDALFVIWQIEEENTENESLDSQMKMKNAVAKAVQCGLQINRLCSNYRVDFKKKLNTTDESITDLVMQQNQLPLPTEVTPRGEIEEDHTFLNVHSGCSCGTFAGIDVGAMDRWEYLMIGDPLQDVADAESAAEKGELVLSKDAHDILCQTRCNSEGENNAVAETKSEHSLNDDPILPCGCTRTANGCYRLSPDFSANAVFFSQMSQDEGDDDIDYEQIYYRHVVDSAFHAFEVSKEFIMQRFHSYLHSSQTSDRNETESDQKKSMLTSASAPVFSKTNLHMEHFVYEFYLKWLMTCLTSDFARHVHEADRIDFEMSKVNRLNCLQTCAEQYKLTSSDGLNDSSAGAGRHSSESFVRRIRSIGASNDRSSSFSENSNYLREKNQKKHEKLLRKDRELTGELRNVIVMFIAIKSTSKPKSITFDSSVDEEDADDCAFSAFKFLKRSRSEKDADVKLKKHYQTCMSLIVSSLKEKGGQLRQFIVDDKGTVAIGSFGLRGSTTYDNAASAVEAALNIILHLQNVGLNAAIGITSGKAYCGVVGSTKRHEYAVMGPSVNLSARLMGQAKPGEIICDVSTRSVDRIHSYRAVGEVKAKGYADLVSIFKPVFNRGSVGLPTGIRTSFFQQVDEGGSRKIKEAKKSNFKELVGRDTEEFEVLSIILTDVADNKSINFLQTVQEILAGSEERRVISESNLNTSCSARILVVNGTSGIGKSALIDSICDKLSRFTKKSSWNLQIFHGKSSSLTISDPFKPWHNIIRSILSQLARYTHIIRERREGEVEVTDRTVIVRKWLKGLDYLSSYLTEEERNWFPLLTTANIVPGIEENDITKKLSGQQKLEVITKLLKSIVNQYPILTNKVLMVVLDDSHFMDPHSWKLTHEILQSNKGIIFLASYYDANEENVNIASIGSGEEPKDALITAATSPRTTGRTQLQELIFELASCRKIKLNGLDAKAIRHMASHIFEGIDLTNVDNSIFSTFEETSGGNPLYIYEIALACLEKMKRYIGETGCEMIDLFTTKDGSKSVFTSLMGEFRTNRIDEVIYYRFDRLDAQSQLLLKMGAIITISNSQRGFNLEMLLHMLNHDSLEPEETTYGKDSMALSPDGDSSKSLRGLFSCFDIKNDNKKNYLLAAQELSAKLQEMTNSSSFIKIVQTRRRSSFNSEKEEMIRAISLTSFRADGENNQKDEPDEDHEEKLLQELSEVYYDFNIALERKTIYDLMLDDQKESLHDRIASHLEKENEHAQKSNYLTFSDLNEEAFHWERATVWGNAMSCYYRAGMILDSLGAFKESYEYLGKAYRMLVLLRKDANVNENVYHKVKFDTLLQEFISLNQSNEQSSLQQSESSFAVTRIDVYNTFGGDANLLEVAINLLLRFGQASFSLGENASFTSRIYEDALRLMI